MGHGVLNPVDVQQHLLLASVPRLPSLHWLFREAAYAASTYRHTIMLTDAQFTEYKLWGARTRVEEFRTWLENYKAWIYYFLGSCQLENGFDFRGFARTSLTTLEKMGKPRSSIERFLSGN